jgi:hypothetical protein
MNEIAIKRRKLADAIDWSVLLTNPGALDVKQVFILVKQAPSRLHVAFFCSNGFKKKKCSIGQVAN